MTESLSNFADLQLFVRVPFFWSMWQCLFHTDTKHVLTTSAFNNTRNSSLRLATAAWHRVAFLQTFNLLQLFCHKAFVNSPCGPHLLKCTIATLKRNGRTGGLAETPDVIWMRPYSFSGWLALLNQMEIAGCDHDFLINSARQRSWIAELVSINKESSKTSPCATLKPLHKTL